MFVQTSKAVILGGAAAILATTVVMPSIAQAGNVWANSEKNGSCYIPNRQTNFRCQFGSYYKDSKVRQIGGFYVNPTNNVGVNGTIPFEYRINGGSWISRPITMNSTSGNYIDFGDGVSSFDFRFSRPSGALGDGGATIFFKMNYDLDQ